MKILIEPIMRLNMNGQSRARVECEEGAEKSSESIGSVVI